MGKLTRLLTGLLLISITFMGLTTFLTDITGSYDVVVSDNYQDIYSNMNESNVKLENISLGFQEKIETQQNNPSILGWVDQLIYSAWTTLAMSVQSIDLAGDMIDSTATIPGMQQNLWFSNGIKTIIMLAITLTLLGLMFKKEL